MGVEPVQDWQNAIASALEWWRDAGVDTLAEDDPRDWLAPPAAAAGPAAAALAVAAAAAEPEPILPNTLDEFIAWRMSDAAPEADWVAPRIAPGGPADAEWTLLIDMPEPGDSETLVGGAPGRLLDNMLAAIGLSRASVYLAPIAFARPVTGKIDSEIEARLFALTRHHLALVRPKKLLLLGRTAARILKETDGSAPGNDIHDINYFGGTTRVIASYQPRFLVERPAFKSEAWKHLLLLSRGIAE